MKKDLIFVIFGSTGDLTSRKLMPAITKLYKNKKIPNNSLVISLGRRNYDNKEYINYLKETKHNIDYEVLSNINEYYKMQITDNTDYSAFKKYIDKYSDENTKIIYYLAVGPELYTNISKNLYENKLVEKNNLNHLIIFEKPFGSNLKTAKELNKTLWDYFNEEQIYRIDHYLGKEMIQNIYNLRFENEMFEKIWNKDNITNIKITAIEEEGILNRGSFYDNAGLMRDIFQNHLLQIFSLLTMNKPENDDYKNIINKKVEALNNFDYNKNNIIFGQYDNYLEEKDVKENSSTETMLFIETYCNSKELNSVPIYILAGKRMNKKLNKIEINFINNKIKIYVDPKEEIILYFKMKEEGLNSESRMVKIVHPYDKEKIDAYEKLLLDIVNSEKRLFTRFDEIEKSWEITDKILSAKKELFKYSDINDVAKKIKGVF